MDTLSDERVVVNESLFLDMMSYPSPCYILDITNNSIVKERGIKAVLIRFTKHTEEEVQSQNGSIKVFAFSKNMSGKRRIKSNSFYSSGDEMRLVPGFWNSFVQEMPKVLALQNYISFQAIFFSFKNTKRCS